MSFFMVIFALTEGEVGHLASWLYCDEFFKAIYMFHLDTGLMHF